MRHELLADLLPLLVMTTLCVVVLRVLIGVSGAQLRFRHLFRLHHDEKGAVQSLSFVLTLPAFMMVMVLILQLSQITVARLTVEYAAFAAARSAAVWIPANLGDDYESSNRISILGPYEDEDGNFSPAVEDEEGILYARYLVQDSSRKFDKIHLAASMAVMSICPSRDGVASTAHLGNRAADSVERAYFALSPAAGENGRIPARIRNKLAYALENTRVEIEIRHKDSEPPLQARHEIRPYLDEFAENEIGFQDQLLVTVFHNFALLPGPARILARPPVNANGAQPDRLSNSIQRENGLFVYPLQATVRLNNEGEKPSLTFLQQLY